MSKLKVSLIEDTSASDAEENHEPDEAAGPVLCDEPPIQPREKPKRIRKQTPQSTTTTATTREATTATREARETTSKR